MQQITLNETDYGAIYEMRLSTIHTLSYALQTMNGSYCGGGDIIFRGLCNCLLLWSPMAYDINLF